MELRYQTWTVRTSKLCLQGDCAILIVGTATIFSHIMLKSVEQIEQTARKGIT
jgi:hypothetical protein